MPETARAEIGRTSPDAPFQHASRAVVLFGLLSLVGTTLLVAAGAAATPPGTQIVNVATASASSGGSVITSTSNATVTPVAPPAILLGKRADPAGPLRPGDTIRYTLSIENASATDLTGVRLIDPLDPWIVTVSGLTNGEIENLAGPGRVTAGGTYDAASRTVRFNLPAVPAGFRGELSFMATLAGSIPDETAVRNVFTAVSNQDPNGITSPIVTTYVVSPSIDLILLAARDRVEVGEIVGFSLRVSNVSTSLPLTGASILFTLPEAFRYRTGTFRAGGRPSVEPAIDPRGRGLRIDAGDLAPGDDLEFTLAAVASAASRRGEVVAKATATALTPSGIPIQAGPRRATLHVLDGVIASEAVIAGRVFADADGNGRSSASEAGVPGVRLYLEDGTQVVTDVAGKYHFEGVRPGLHVLKLDPETAPRGLSPVEIGHRSSGSSGVQFLDLGGSELFRADFALRGSRSAMAAMRVDRMEYGLDGRTGAVVEPVLPLLLTSALFDPGSAALRPDAAGIIESFAEMIRDGGALEGGLNVSSISVEEEGDLQPDRRIALEAAIEKALHPGRVKGALPGTGFASRDPAPAGVVPAVGSDDGNASVAPAGGSVVAPAEKPPAIRSTEDLLKVLPAGLYLLSPRPGAVVDAERIDVDVAFVTGSGLRLTVNEQEIAEDRVGMRMETSRSAMSLHRYVGLDLRTGENVVAVEMEGSGGEAKRIEVRVDRVGQPARVIVYGQGGAQPADGRTAGLASVEVRDARGHAVSDGTLVTIDASAGAILGRDADSRTDGFQARTEQGRALVRLSPAGVSESRTITAAAGPARGSGEVRFGPYLRDWIVAGVGQAGWSGGGGSPLGGPGFTGDLSSSPDADARLAFYARGAVGGEGTLSLSYDSARERDETSLFRTQDPTRSFPVYGDGSAQSYDLESQGKLAVRWEQDRTMLMYGDFRTGLAAAELTRYDRTLSGGLVHVENPHVTIHAFGATTPQTSVRDAFPSDGSSGPYHLSRRPLVAYSERVIFEVRDRQHSEKILSTSTQNRFSDYDIDYTAGTILFRSSVPSQDEHFNPVTVVVTYETLDVSGSNLVAGGRIGYRPSSRFEWGNTVVHEQRGNDVFSLTGTDFTIRPWAGAAITAEYARASEGARDSGAVALRLNVAAGRSATIGAYLRDVPPDFSNPSMTGVSEIGTRKEGVELLATLPDGSRLAGEAFRQEQSVTGVDRQSASLGWMRTAGAVTFETGGRALTGTTEGTGEDGSSDLLRAGLRARLSSRFDAGVSRDQIVAGDTVSGFPTRTDLGAGYRFNDQVRGFIRHEIDEGEIRDTQRSMLGVEGSLNDRTTVESRYALEDAMTGERGYATLGVRTRFPLNDLWSADLRAERAETVLGDGVSDFSALSGAAEYLPGRSKFTSRYEVRFGEMETRHLLTAAGAIKLSPDLVLFTKQRMGLTEPTLGDGRLDADGLVGLAFRPLTADRFNWLGRLQATRGETLPGGATSLASAPFARSLLGVFELNYQPTGRWHLLGRYAGRYAGDTFAGTETRSYTEVWESRCLADVGKRFTAGLSARLLRQVSTETTLTGVGVESGFMVARDLWFVGGYNVTGFSDQRFPDGERRAQGPFVTLRFKFDETLFGGLTAREGGRETPSPIPDQASTGSRETNAVPADQGAASSTGAPSTSPGR